LYLEYTVCILIAARCLCLLFLRDSNKFSESAAASLQ
jgi:hypothetical protein